MAKKPDQRRMRAWQSLLLSHNALFHQLDRELEEAVGMPLQWYEVLLRIYRAPGRRMRMQELVDSMLFTPSGVTRLVDRLVENGLVRREKCPSDLRGTYAALTEHGVASFRKAGPVHLKGIQQHFGCHLTDDEADALAEGLGRIVEVLTPDRRPV
jgi:DNA-binding MarR family transcriptional regulator